MKAGMTSYCDYPFNVIEFFIEIQGPQAQRPQEQSGMFVVPNKWRRSKESLLYVLQEGETPLVSLILLVASVSKRNASLPQIPMGAVLFSH